MHVSLEKVHEAFIMIVNLTELAKNIKNWGQALGFQAVGITDTDLGKQEAQLFTWLAKQYHGEMKFMEKHGTKRTRPHELVPNTLRIISVRMDYFPPDKSIINILNNKYCAYVSRYALGKDYHKLIRKRLALLAAKINAACVGSEYRVFCDSAPVLEKPIAQKAGLGFMGKHTNLINTKAGSWFFIGEIYTNIPLPIDEPIQQSHCGSCTACIDVCPTQAIIGPYQLDARRCISYLTIELRESIPVAFRSAIGNRIYGCDDCQLVCPWNKFAKYTKEVSFHPREQLQSATLLSLFAWDKETFLKRTEGSAIRRIGFDCWQRNIAVALGNAPADFAIINALQKNIYHTSLLVREHIEWALQKQLERIRYI